MIPLLCLVNPFSDNHALMRKRISNRDEEPMRRKGAG